MNKIDLLRSILGRDFADQFVKEIENHPGLYYHDPTDAINLCSASLAYDATIPVLSPSSGTPMIEIYPQMTQREASELWKCDNCGKVHRLSEHLECQGCGTSISENSKFVLV